MDIARTVARLQRRRYGRVRIALASLESREIMPADDEEIVEAGEEGVSIHPGWGPADILVEEGRVVGLELKRCTRVFDENRRFSPTFDESDRIRFEVDMVIESVGQAADTSYLEPEIAASLEMTQGRRIKVDEEGRTSIPWLFAGGDLVHGPDAIHAIADGHAAARGIDRFLRG